MTTRNAATRRPSALRTRKATSRKPWEKFDWLSYDWSKLDFDAINSQVDFRGADLEFLWSIIPEEKLTDNVVHFFNMRTLCLECNTRLEADEATGETNQQSTSASRLLDRRSREDPPAVLSVLELGPADKGFKISKDGTRVLVNKKRTFHQIRKEEAQEVDEDETEIDEPQPKKPARKRRATAPEPAPKTPARKRRATAPEPRQRAESNKRTFDEMDEEETVAEAQKPEPKKRARKAPTATTAPKPGGRNPKKAATPETIPPQADDALQSTASQMPATLPDAISSSFDLRGSVVRRNMTLANARFVRQGTAITTSDQATTMPVIPAPRPRPALAERDQATLNQQRTGRWTVHQIPNTVRLVFKHTPD